MPSTPNYSWTIPTVNGDTGAWGGILNAAFTEVDADLQAVSVAAAAAQTTATAAQTTATAAQTTATNAQTAVNNKILIATRAPTGSDSATDGTLWCQV